jgi:hypothetical protein
VSFRLCASVYDPNPESAGHDDKNPHSIRNRLTALKKDRSEYILASDVLSIYEAVIKQGKQAFSRLVSVGSLPFPRGDPTKHRVLSLTRSSQVTKLNEVRDARDQAGGPSSSHARL